MHLATSHRRMLFLLSTNAIHLLPYTGAGSGILRALSGDVDVSFINNDSTNEFVITINRQERNQNIVNSDTRFRDSDTGFGTNSDTSTADYDTTQRNSDTDLEADYDTRRPKITNKQKDIVNFCNVPRSSKEILERAGVTYHSKNIQTYIMALVEAGYLEKTNPNHPNASNQKYRRSKR